MSSLQPSCPRMEAADSRSRGQPAPPIPCALSQYTHTDVHTHTHVLHSSRPSSQEDLEVLSLLFFASPGRWRDGAWM